MKKFIIFILVSFFSFSVIFAQHPVINHFYIRFYDAKPSIVNGIKRQLTAVHCLFEGKHTLILMESPYNPFLQEIIEIKNDTCLNVELYPIDYFSKSKISLYELNSNYTEIFAKYLDGQFMTTISIPSKSDDSNDSDPKVWNIQPESTIPLSNNCVNWIFHVKSSEKGFALEIEDILRVLHQRNSNFRYEIIIDGD